MGAQAVDTAAEAPPAGPSPGRRRRRGLRIAVAVAVAATGGAVAVSTLGLGGDGTDGGGGPAGGLPLATAEVVRRTLHDTQTEDGELAYGPARTASARLTGTLTALPRGGAVIGRGKEMYAVDAKPVVLLYGTTPAYRPLEQGDEGRDVRQLEENLRALGHTGFTVDGTYTAATAAAVEDWQHDLGLRETGAVDLGRVVFAPGAVRVESVTAQAGDATGPGQKVFTYTGTARAVTVELDTADQALAKKDAAVRVRLPDGRRVAGVVRDVSTAYEPGENGGSGTTKVEVTVALRGAAARTAARAYGQAAVHVDFTTGTRKDVLTVPVGALLALAEGGYGVEVVHGSTSRYLRVETGLFANGRVEVSGAGLRPGMKVGMPA